ncbi:MAG: Rrf2 family transcriptional regulator [Candidatus Kerfeldbacteria bacterium]|nr:Rrf2 family transcriptional regulator [Candidatus Kerfeldbacteria bacterium]
MLLKLSARGEYGLMILKYLAKVKPGQYLSLKEIASRQKLPVKYLEQVVKVLARANLVKAKQGTQGGYKLSIGPKQMNLALILDVLEGGIKPAQCHPGCHNCKRTAACEKKTGWKKIHQALYKKLNQVSLADLIK